MQWVGCCILLNRQVAELYNNCLSGDLDFVLFLVDHQSAELWNYMELQYFLFVKTLIVIISSDSVRQ